VYKAVTFHKSNFSFVRKSQLEDLKCKTSCLLAGTQLRSLLGELATLPRPRSWWRGGLLPPPQELHARSRSLWPYYTSPPFFFYQFRFSKMKKRSEETQTLRAGCSKAEPKIFAPPQTPSRGRRTAKSLDSQLEMVTTFTYRPSLVRIDACNFELSW